MTLELVSPVLSKRKVTPFSLHPTPPHPVATAMSKKQGLEVSGLQSSGHLLPDQISKVWN